MAMATALLILVLAIPAAYATPYTVGDSSGWTNFGVDYSTWASGKTFTVGDTLLFNYGSTHQVAEVTQSDYNSCSSSNAIQTYNDGSTTITLSKAGSMYFICPTAGHCSSGMKLAINVVAASTTPGTTPPTTPSPAPPSGSTTPTAGSPPTTPSTNTSSPSPAGNGAASKFINLNNLVFGFLLVFAYLMG